MNRPLPWLPLSGVLSCALLCAPASAQEKAPPAPEPQAAPAAPAVKPSTWKVYTRKKGIGAIVAVPFPPGLVERGLVHLESLGMSAEDTLSIRRFSSQSQGWTVSVGCMYLHTRDDNGKAILKAKPAIQPRTSGFVAAKAAKKGEAPVFQLHAMGSQSSLKDGPKGITYKTRFQLTSRGKIACEFQLVVSLSRLEAGKDPVTTCEGEWTGPFPSDPPPPLKPIPPLKTDPAKKTGKTPKKGPKRGKR